MATRIDTTTPLGAYYQEGCARCGIRRNLIDADTYIRLEGHLAFCTGCIADFAGAAGMYVTERGAERVKEAESKAKAALEAADDAADTLDRLYQSYKRITARKQQASKQAPANQVAS